MFRSVSKSLFVGAFLLITSCVFSPSEADYDGITSFVQERSSILSDVRAIKFLPDNKVIIVGGHKYSIIDLNNGMQILFESVLVDYWYYDVDFSAETNSIYISASENRLVRVFDLDTYNHKSFFTVPGFSRGSKLSVVGDMMYLLAREGDYGMYYLFSIDLSDLSIVDSIPIGASGSNISIEEMIVADDLILIATSNTNAGGYGKIIKVSRQSFSILGSTTFEHNAPFALGYDSQRRILLVSAGGRIELLGVDTYNKLRIIDDQTRWGPISVDSNSGYAYIAGDDIYVVDMIQMKVVNTIESGSLGGFNHIDIASDKQNIIVSGGSSICVLE